MMFFRITGMMVLSNYCRTLDPVVFVNDDERNAFVSFRMWDEPGGGPDTRELVVVNLRESGTDLLALPGNYLVVSDAVELVRRSLGLHSNAMVVSESVSRDELMGLLGDLFECLRQRSAAVWTAVSVAFFSHDKELRPLLSAIEGQLGHALALFDDKGRVVEAGNRARGELGDSLAHVPAVALDSVSNEDDYPVEMEVAGQSRVVVCPISYAVGDAFFLMLFGVVEDSRNLRMLLYSLSPLVRYILGERRGPRYERLLDAEFLVEAIAGRWETPALLAQRAERAGVSVEAGSRLVVVGFREDRALYSDVVLFHESLQWLRSGITCVYGYEVIALVSGKEVGPFLDALPGLLEMRRDKGPACGISLPLASVTEVRAAHRQCLQAVRVGRVMNPRRQVFWYEVIMTDDLVREAGRHMGLSPFRLPATEAMLRYDQEEQSEYALTLYVWLHNFQNMGKTAADLCVHRNTVAFRLKRAEKLFGLDTDDVDQMNDVRCALMVMVSEGRLSVRDCFGDRSALGAVRRGVSAIPRRTRD